MGWTDARDREIESLRRKINDAQRELDRLENLPSDPGHPGTVVRWIDPRTGTFMAARRQTLGEWDVTGGGIALTWDELMNLVGHAHLETADDFSTLVRGTES